MMATYIVIMILFCVPLAMRFFAATFFPKSSGAAVAEALSVTSPFTAAFAIPLHFGNPNQMPDHVGDWAVYFSYLGFTSLMIGVLLGTMIWLFNTRWRVAE